MDDTQRQRDIARAALLRERIIGALRASPIAMGYQELCGMSGLVELYDKRRLPQRVDAQLHALRKSGVIDRVEKGRYAIAKRAEAPALPTLLQTLRLEVSKSEKIISFIFEGLQVQIKVLP